MRSGKGILTFYTMFVIILDKRLCWKQLNPLKNSHIYIELQGFIKKERNLVRNLLFITFVTHSGSDRPAIRRQRIQTPVSELSHAVFVCFAFFLQSCVYICNVFIKNCSYSIAFKPVSVWRVVFSDLYSKPNVECWDVCLTRQPGLKRLLLLLCVRDSWRRLLDSHALVLVSVTKMTTIPVYSSPHLYFSATSKRLPCPVM